MTLTEAFDLYRLEYIEYEHQSQSTEEGHDTCLGLLLEHFGDIQIEELTVPMIRGWKRQLEHGRAQNTVRGYVIKLRVVLAWLRAEGRATVVPVERIGVPKRKKTIVSFLPPEDVQRLIDASGQVHVRINAVRNQAILSLIYSSGIRLSECVGLDRLQVRTDVFSVASKGSDPRPCFIDARTRRYLDEYLKLRTEGYDIYWMDRGKLTKRVRRHYEPDNESALFLNHQTGRRITAADIQDIMKNSRRNAGITTRATVHTLRHSFATDLLRHNCNIRHVQAMLGHKSLETTQIYTHVVDFDLMQAHKNHHSI